MIVLTASATSVLMAVGTDNRTRPSGADQDAQTINLLNNVVVGMIVVFAAVVVINTFAAVVAHRKAELHRLWLLGATPEQVEGSVLAEARPSWPGSVWCWGARFPGDGRPVRGRP